MRDTVSMRAARTGFVWLGFGIALALSSCGQPLDDESAEFLALECPAPAASAEPNLHVSGDRLYLSWLLHGESHHSFQYAVLEDGDWSRVYTIAEGDSFFANWADVPSLVQLDDGSLLAHWLWKSGGDTYAYDVMVSRATNGIDWQPAIRPHRDGTQTEHGFVSLIPTAGAGAMAVWLDGRDYAGKGHEEAEMQLMCASLEPHGVTPESPIDPRVCDCCPTASVRTASGALLAYRDRSPDEIRDIYLLRHENGAWSEPYPLSNDGWQIAGCPVNGPALDSDGQRVVAAWFTLGSDQQASVRVAFSEDAGRTFTSPVRVDDGEPLGRTDAVLLPGGDALVAWLESPADSTTTIRARRVHPDGQMDESFVVTVTSADRASGFPRLVRAGESLYFAWTQIDAVGEDATDERSRVRMSRMRLPDSWRVQP
jgi:hypothetical protein